MKKIILLFMVVILFPFMVSAQVRFGVKVGGQASVIKNIHSGSELRLPGINTGILARIPLQSGSFSAYGPMFLNLEIIYSQEGEKGDKCNFYQDFINMPILLRYHLPKMHTLFFEAGPQVGLMIKESESRIDENSFGRNKEFNLSASAGVGACFGPKYQFEVSARFNYGFMDMYPETVGTNNHMNAAVSVAYLFGGGREKRLVTDVWDKNVFNDQVNEARRNANERKSVDEEKDAVEDYDDSETLVSLVDPNSKKKPVEEETEAIIDEEEVNITPEEDDEEVLVSEVVEPKKSEPKVEPKSKMDNMIGSISFGECKTGITSRHISTISTVAKYMKENPSATLLVVGYADKGTGNAVNNMKFSERRATAARNYLIWKYGISPDRIKADWKGDIEQPLVQIENRCVLFFVK